VARRLLRKMSSPFIVLIEYRIRGGSENKFFLA